MVLSLAVAGVQRRGQVRKQDDWMDSRRKRRPVSSEPEEPIAAGEDKTDAGRVPSGAHSSHSPILARPPPARGQSGSTPYHTYTSYHFRYFWVSVEKQAVGKVLSKCPTETPVKSVLNFVIPVLSEKQVVA
ncbi:hypothetical protein H920_09245 [Fukomys damarensis]|uniref:Uncharacterized protein n=1 Tax=Fukomys damarensis TaxID=885580 RepID=A0A091E2S6_FUKDA|nr:hypothetical protein H920_09245 [Fukomys damarensis]